MQKIKILINGEWKSGWARPGQTLLDFLQKELFHTEVKRGCERGDCGACTVIMNDTAVDSCLILALQANGATITTARGLGTPDNMHPLQKAFAEKGAIQCGFCTPGMILAAQALLNRNQNPSREEIKRGLSGNLCRCTGYEQIIDAVERAAKQLSGV